MRRMRPVGGTAATCDPIVAENRRRMVALLGELAPTEGLHATAVDGVHLRRANARITRTPVLYESSAYIVASGRKNGYVGNRRLVYDSNNYLVLSAPLPFECEVDIDDGDPLLAISVRMELGIVSELAAGMGEQLAQETADARACVHATPLDAALGDAVVRLLQCLRCPTDAAILGPQIKREITYRVLCGPRGATLLSMVGRNGHASQVYAILRRIHANFADPLNVALLAEEAGMSVTAFHQHFKAVTSASPMQYVKAVRLHKARMLIHHDSVGAAVAAYRVGYESASQFSREYKRLFGRSPGEELKYARGGAARDRHLSPSPVELEDVAR
jgi:AraC-like DNA-binding protein